MPLILAILGCVLSSMVIGYLWYSKWLFAKEWMRLVGLSEHQMKKDGVWVSYLITMAAALLEALVLSVVFSFVQVENVTESMKIGFLMWSGFIATTQLTNALFAQKPLKLFLIEAGYHLVAIMAMSVILTVWRF
jgi:hypothetical protein